MIKDFMKSLITAFQDAVGYPLSRYFKRRLLLCHGRELVHDVSLYKDYDEDVRRKLCRTGIVTLRAVGPNEAEMKLHHLDDEGDGWVLQALQLA